MYVPYNDPETAITEQQFFHGSLLPTKHSLLVMMEHNVTKKQYGITLAAILVAAFLVVQPIKGWSQEDVGAEQVGFMDCVLYPSIDVPVPYEDSIDMNTVVIVKGTTEYAKTIHREKQLFLCDDLNDPTIPFIVEVALFIEIIQNMDTRTVAKRHVEVIACVKGDDPFFVHGNGMVGAVRECQRQFPTVFQNPDISKLITATGCDSQDAFGSHPLEMNTVVDPDSPANALTVDAEKEVFTCTNGQPELRKKIDLIIFNSLWEDPNRLPSGIPVVKRFSEAVQCLISIQAAKVEQCWFNFNLLTPP
jgi:hypothetical protein